MYDLTILCGIALKSFILLSAVWLALRLCPRKSAAVQHGVWTLGFVGCLMLPIVSLFIPKWSVPILPQRTVSEKRPAFNTSATPGVAFLTQRDPTMEMERYESAFQATHFEAKKRHPLD